MIFLIVSFRPRILHGYADKGIKKKIFQFSTELISRYCLFIENKHVSISNKYISVDLGQEPEAKTRSLERKVHGRGEGREQRNDS